MSGRYRYCGLTLHCEPDLPELPAASPDEETALEIRRAPVAAESLGGDRFRLDGDEALWQVEGLARCRISRGGRLIEVEPDPRCAPGALRRLLLQPLFAIAAAMHGERLLHAAAVEVDGAVIAFTGPAAVGKSTAAAILAAHGHEVVADGLLRLTTTADGGVLAHPQAPWLLLRPDTVERLVFGGAARPLQEGEPRHRVVLPAAAGPLPLSRIVVLDGEGADVDDPFEPPVGRSSEGVRIVALTESSPPGAPESIPIERLEPPREWSRLDEFAETLERWANPEESSG